MTQHTLIKAIKELPAFPAAAAAVVRRSKHRLTAEELVSLGGTDPVLAGSLIKAANSAAYQWSGTVRTLQEAVFYLGEIAATHILVTAALRPLLTILGHTACFEHSFEAAHVSMRIAADSHGVSGIEAYVLGLLHDVGQLLFMVSSPTKAHEVDRLVTNGFDRRSAELTTFGITHGSASAEVLRHWQMPRECQEAIAYHHTPELGGGCGAAVLYLAEQWTDPQDDPPCETRIQHVTDMLQLDSSYYLGGDFTTGVIMPGVQADA